MQITIKNTFLDVNCGNDSDADGEADPKSSATMFRASSDPGLFEAYGGGDEEEVDDMIMAGFDDRETDDEVSTTRTPLQCYQHIALAQDEMLELPAAAAPQWNQKLQKEVDILANENARLIEENRLLADACRAATAASDAARASYVGAQVPFSEACMAAISLHDVRCVAVPPATKVKQQQYVMTNQYHTQPTQQRFRDNSPPAACNKTTVMLRNLPNNYNRLMLLAMIDSEGFAGKYDFVYLPIDFNTLACLGYAFVNLATPSIARQFWQCFEGYSKWAFPSRKNCYVSWSDPHQGLQSNLDRYRNSPVMHEVVPDEYKPIVFEDGVRISFPSPTKKIRLPRIRNHGETGAGQGFKDKVVRCPPFIT